MYNYIRLPKNLAKFKDNKAFSDYCLNPLGLKTRSPNYFVKPQKQEWFLNEQIILHRGEKELDGYTFAIRCKPQFSKPELKQYFEKIYNLEVDKVTTINYMGRIRRNINNKNYREKDFKKAYITLKTPVPKFISHMANYKDE